MRYLYRDILDCWFKLFIATL